MFRNIEIKKNCFLLIYSLSNRASSNRSRLPSPRSGIGGQGRLELWHSDQLESEENRGFEVKNGVSN